MRRFAFALASVVVLAGGSASAATGIQDHSIGYQAGSVAVTPDLFALPEGAGVYPEPGGGGNGTGGAAYNSFVTLGGHAITFESSNAVSQGPFESFTSSSTVSFVFQNDTGGFVPFHSEITPQGVGLYLADTSGGCIFTNSCAQVSDEDYQFQQLVPPGGSSPSDLGGVDVSFEILDNGSSIYSVSGSLHLFYHYDTSDCLFTVCVIDGLGTSTDPQSVRSLNGFAKETFDHDFSAVAFGWGATPIEMELGEGSHLIEYRTSVTTFTNADCLGAYETVCLIAYGGFGDPIGRGGGISASSVGAFDVSAQDHGDDQLIGGLNFTPQKLLLPSYDDDGLHLRLSSATPEPSTWALMIGGFGLAGAALRRRRVPAHS